MIPAALQGAAFLEDVRQADTSGDIFHVWWLGQSGFLLGWNGRFLLFDPYLSDSLTEKYADTERPHVRMSERVVAPERLSFVEVATSSHNHTDHLDAATLCPLVSANPRLRLVLPEANIAFARDRLADCLPAEMVGLDAGKTVEVGAFRISGVPAAHEALDRDESGRHRYLGFIVRFGRWSVYHSGDTLWYDGLEERVRPFGVTVAILPINGRDPARGVAGNLNGAEAARLGREIGAGVVIPCHYDMFTFNTASPDRFVEKCREVDQPFRVLRAGERWSSSG